MIWKRYQNELIVAASLFLFLFAFGYKSVQVSSNSENTAYLKRSVNEFKELIILQKRWADKKISKKVDKLKKLVPSSKLKWNKKGKKLTVNYTGLNAKELNKVVTAVLNLAIQIQVLEIKNNNALYNMELKCKW